MNRSVEFHRLALQEVRGITSWYRQRSTRAAEQFVAGLALVIQRLEIDPESFALLARRHRQIRISKFPYCVVFQVRLDGSVHILAIAHTSRRPGYWRKRK